ncbi:hypothetical protein JTB14_005460 [Gonioctena quinquepunctata]|nr:hypothetical protein JTB14_005460 [Gonioctena quinquepunctata]
MKFLVVALLSTTLCVMLTESQESCGTHERYFECKPCHEVPCGQTPPDVCPADCIQTPGCYCEEGYRRLRRFAFPTAKCVLPSEC